MNIKLTKNQAALVFTDTHDGEMIIEVFGEGSARQLALEAYSDVEAIRCAIDEEFAWDDGTELTN